MHAIIGCKMVPGKKPGIDEWMEDIFYAQQKNAEKTDRNSSNGGGCIFSHQVHLLAGTGDDAGAKGQEAASVSRASADSMGDAKANLDAAKDAARPGKAEFDPDQIR